MMRSPGSGARVKNEELRANSHERICSSPARPVSSHRPRSSQSARDRSNPPQQRLRTFAGNQVKSSGQECPLHIIGARLCITTTSAAPRFTMFEARAPCAAYCAVPPMTVPLSVSISNSSVPLFTKTVLKFSADDPLGVIFIVPVQSDNSV